MTTDEARTGTEENGTGKRVGGLWSMPLSSQGRYVVALWLRFDSMVTVVIQAVREESERIGSKEDHGVLHNR